MQVDVLFDPFRGTWDDLRDAARLAEEAGLDGVWLYDHLAGSVHRAPHVLECWTVLTAVAATVPRLAVGSLVLNVANRPAGTLAVMAATLQHISGGRLLLGIGAGGGPSTPYAAEQRALGRAVPGAAARRAAVEDAVTTLRRVWSGSVGEAHGFLRPDPEPPVIVGGFGPEMAALAGRVGDGINAPPGPHLAGLVATARDACAAAGRDPDAFLVTTSAPADPGALDRLAASGVDRAILMVHPPYVDGTSRLVAALRR